ncbi:MAG: hypothetical protein ACP5JG_00260 [Anaerolineae bacterium]
MKTSQTGFVRREDDASMYHTVNFVIRDKQRLMLMELGRDPLRHTDVP